MENKRKAKALGKEGKILKGKNIVNFVMSMQAQKRIISPCKKKKKSPVWQPKSHEVRNGQGSNENPKLCDVNENAREA